MPLSVEDALKKMNANRLVHKEKGDFGEQAIIAIVRSYQELAGGTIIHSFRYPYATNRQNVPYPGNIHLDNGDFVEVKSKMALQDEIDVVYITKYRIFSIECKARGGTWRLENKWCSQNGRPVDKSPLAQAEKHVRHLYHSIYEYLPDGNPNYIIPLTVFVDKARVLDSRNDQQKVYIPIAIADILKQRIKDCDSPLKYSLDTEGILAKMLKIGKGTVFK